MEKCKSKIRIPTFPRLIPLSLKIKNERRTQPHLLPSSFRLIPRLENADQEVLTASTGYERYLPFLHPVRFGYLHENKRTVRYLAISTDNSVAVFSRHPFSS